MILGRQGPGSLDGFWGWPFWSGIHTFSEDYLNFSSTSPDSHLLSTSHPELLLKGCPVAFVTLGFAVSSMLSAPAYSNYHPTSCSPFLITAHMLEKPSRDPLHMSCPHIFPPHTLMLPHYVVLIVSLQKLLSQGGICHLLVLVASCLVPTVP